MKLTKQQALKKIEELKDYVNQINDEWVTIDYNVIPKEVFDKYGAKPFKIMKRKMRKNGEVWNNINYFDAQKECEKLGYRLPKIQEMLVLLEWYKKENKEVDVHDEEFLGIEELSYDESVYLEWVYCLDSVAFLRGGYWGRGANAGVFTLRLNSAPAHTLTNLGFRCSSDL